VSSSPYSGQGLDDGALAIVHMPQGADVNLRLDLLTLPTGRLRMGPLGKV
jgi:hypothetical protein